MRTCKALILTLMLGFIIPVHGDSGTERGKGELQWVKFPDRSRFKVLGLFWFEQNSPKLWRMPAKEMESLPKGVQNRSKCPSGGRILMRCNTSRLGIKLADPEGGLRGFDVYVDGVPLRTEGRKPGEHGELILFEDLNRKEKEILIYLPHLRDVVVTAIGVDQDTKFAAPEHKFARSLPVVFYGSSVCQGSGAAHSGMTYGAILCRELNVDFVNLGFGGAGKAEKEVVALVNSIPACCYVFDLGKSYGMQESAPFKAMLATIRQSHPAVPLVVITPITSAKEVNDKSYSDRSVHIRTLMRGVVEDLTKAGDKNLILVEGPDLLGFKEHDGLSKDGVHPSDQGYDRMAKKLLPVLKGAVMNDKR